VSMSLSIISRKVLCAQSVARCAVDDDHMSTEYLAANKFVIVQEIPEDAQEMAKFLSRFQDGDR
jgi:hypothetical protein